MEDFEKVDLKKVIEEDCKEYFKNTKKELKIPNPVLPYILFGIGFFGTIIFIALAEDLKSLGYLYPIILSLIILSGVIGAIFLSIYYSKKKKFRNSLKENFNMVKYFNIELSNITQGYIKNMRIADTYKLGIFKVEAFVKGVETTGASFVNFNLEDQGFSYGVVNSRTLVTVSKNNQRIYNYYTQTFMVANFEYDVVEAPINFYYSKSPFFKEKGIEKIELESNDFNKQTNVYSTNQILSRKFLSPKKMNNLLDFNKNKDQVGVKYLFMDRNSIFMEVLNRAIVHKDTYIIWELPPGNNIKTISNEIYKKVTSESKDIFSTLKYIQTLEVFPD
ncbi:hypothetical protein SSABA_v1c08580 [Spiroplasma sabaudiense Ar-1343]|uniref:DUF3137 domain-containing protein n=1 Tax=Spiroplasma sabaudiense Ar-1343 TaxID=1276257 RepID=W6AB40_9MOLU|nr:DUF3137 domain-containing protein [Spiroplasma sabaudiense]AHI54257.1 hypothetical protein SSABA_v1c08580 [Spiroplasma sabaudiense Ar-1343]